MSEKPYNLKQAAIVMDGIAHPIRAMERKNLRMVMKEYLKILFKEQFRVQIDVADVYVQYLWTKCNHLGLREIGLAVEMAQGDSSEVEKVETLTVERFQRLVEQYKEWRRGVILYLVSNEVEMI